jgi:hypothetical protein
LAIPSPCPIAAPTSRQQTASPPGPAPSPGLGAWSRAPRR